MTQEKNPNQETRICPACGYLTETASCHLCDGAVTEADSAVPIKIGPRFFLFDLVEGFLSPFQGFLLLMTRKEYMGKLGWPVILNILAIGLIGGGLGYGFYTLFEYFGGRDWGWFESWRPWVGGILSGLLALLALYLTAPAIIEAVTAPFLDPIAHATEQAMAGEKIKPLDQGFWRSVWYGVRTAAQILALQLLLLIPILLFSLIPGVIFLALLLSAYLTALIWFEIPVMRRGYGMRYRRRIIRRNWARAIGFGLGFQVGLLVPFFNILFLTPSVAIAVTRLYFRFEKGLPWR